MQASIKLGIRLFIYLLFSGISLGQVLNIEKERLQQDSLKPLKMKLVADMELYNRSITAEKTNKVLDVGLGFNILYEPQAHAYILIAETNYNRTNGVGVLDYGYIHARVNWWQKNKVSLENFAQLSYDNSRGMKIRNIVGANMRVELLSNQNFDIYVGTGLMFENEKWKHPVEAYTRSSNMVKSNNYLSLQYRLNDFLDVNNVFYYQTGFRDKQLVNRLSNWLILNTKVTKYIALTSSFELSYDDKPIVPITELIYTFKTGIGFNF